MMRVSRLAGNHQPEHGSLETPFIHRHESGDSRQRKGSFVCCQTQDLELRT
ncbi:hypothetical protein [Rufibacter immobilis]|uniref:hypothetical protein n=1 Tax=Rufibacter immobilis TaxID=1348778 RepID=UPI0035EA4A00